MDEDVEDRFTTLIKCPHCGTEVKEFDRELIRRSDAEEYYGNETFSIGHWIDIGEYRERQRIIEMLEERMEKVDSLENQIVAGKERHHRLDELDKLKQKLKSDGGEE